MKKILIISTGEMQINGISNVIFNLYEPNIGKYNFSFLTNNNIDDRYIKRIDKNDKLYVLPNRKRKIISYSKKLFEIIKENKFDIVHIHGNSETMAIEVMMTKLAFSDSKIIIHNHNTKVSKSSGVLKSMMKKIMFNESSLFLACGSEAGKALYGNRKFSVINNGIFLNNFSYDEKFREVFRLKNNLNDNLLIGCVGRLNNQKNQKFIIGLLCYMRDRTNLDINKIKFVLVGDGPFKYQLENEVIEKELSDYITFIPTSEKINKLYSALDLLVMPSKFEGLPLVAIEAQAAGLTSLLSDCIDNSVDITSNVFFLPIEENDVVYEIWSKKILLFTAENRLLKSEFAIEKLRNNGFDIINSAKMISTIYDNLGFRIEGDEFR